MLKHTVKSRKKQKKVLTTRKSKVIKGKKLKSKRSHNRLKLIRLKKKHQLYVKRKRRKAGHSKSNRRSVKALSKQTEPNIVHTDNYEEAYNKGFNSGFAKGFEDGNQLEYQSQ
ncbi:hypothetical protein [Paenibacillus sp. CMAA1364]